MPPGGHQVLTTNAILARVTGPEAASVFLPTTATCPPGTVLLSGGATTMAPPGTAQPSPLHLAGTGPSDGAGTMLGGSAAASASWTGVAESGAGIAGTTTSAFAVCGPAAAFGPARVIVAKAAGPPSDIVVFKTTAGCPPGTVLVGGGAVISAPPGTPQPSPLHLVGSYPSDGAGTPVSGGSATAWTAASESGATIPGAMTTAYAVCAPAGTFISRVVRVDTRGPEVGKAPFAVTASCPPGTVLTGGGATTVPGATPQPSPLHLTGSYPSGPGGAVPAASGTYGSWTAGSESGATIPGTVTSAFAVCVS